MDSGLPDGENGEVAGGYGLVRMRSAVEEAIQLAKACSGKLIAMTTVLTNMAYEGAMPWVIEWAEKDMQEQLESSRRMASERGIACGTFAYRGDDPVPISLESG